MLGVLCLLSLAARNPALAKMPPFGTTIITHGYQLLAEGPLKDDVPWVIEMAMAIEQRAKQKGGRARIYILRKGQIYEVLNREISNLDVKLAQKGMPPDEDHEDIVLLDWVTEGAVRPDLDVY